MADFFEVGFGFKEKKKKKSLSYWQKNFALRRQDGSAFIIVRDWPTIRWSGYKVNVWNKFKENFFNIIIPDNGDLPLKKYEKYGFPQTQFNTMTVLSFKIDEDDEKVFDEEEDDIVEFLKTKTMRKELYHILGGTGYQVWNGEVSRILKKKKNNAIVNRVFYVARMVEKDKSGTEKKNTPVSGNVLKSIKLLSDKEVLEIASSSIDNFDEIYVGGEKQELCNVSEKDLAEYKRNFILPFNYTKAIKKFTYDEVLTGLQDGSIKQSWQGNEQPVPFDEADTKRLTELGVLVSKVEEEEKEVEEEAELPF